MDRSLPDHELHGACSASTIILHKAASIVVSSYVGQLNWAPILAVILIRTDAGSLTRDLVVH